ncbi:membrane protein insertase YidC [Formosimonas limnophila]|uniref:Membrane protein insertase YidC n=2 Tax=Formosimonas limnophila TaxID=1384487 RepID=A0A8J3CN80_9BURK|nr:membrane protein insertase YidC [Formosimonas limnophila]
MPAPTATVQKASTTVGAATTNPTTGVVTTPDASVKPKGQAVVLANDKLRLKINTEGGVIEYAELLEHRDSKVKDKNQDLFTTEGNRIYLSRSGLAGTLGLNHKTPFTASTPEAVLKDGENETSVTLTATENGVTLKKTYTLKRGSYSLGVNHEVDNASAMPIDAQVYLDLSRDDVQEDGSFFYSTYTGPVLYNQEDKFKKVSFTDIADGKAKFESSANNGWIGMLQHYFVAAWVLPNNEERTREFKTVVNKDNQPNVYSIRQTVPLGVVAPAAKANLNTTLYVGPQDQQVLSEIATGLDLSVDYGWATIIAKPIHWLMGFLHNFIPNWGWTIVALTILVKLVLFPLTAASYKSMAKMKLLAPRLKQLQEQYGDDRMKMNQAMMALYKEEKVNPAGGCLPMLAQMPIFLALYYVLQAAVEMRGAPWLWIKDLSLADPFYVLPALMVITMLIQTKLNPKPADPMQAKMMMWMPLIFGVTFFWFPAGLVLYWVVSNIFSIGQQWYMNNKFGIKESLIPLKDESAK